MAPDFPVGFIALIAVVLFIVVMSIVLAFFSWKMIKKAMNEFQEGRSEDGMATYWRIVFGAILFAVVSVVLIIAATIFAMWALLPMM
ncbi:MAG: hypothetical protein FWG08_07140 [Propionibacteriaceae bacterium]|nr:hypothetical protein [Propionibacteriaceae bacterium]